MAYVYAKKMSTFTFEKMRGFLWKRFARIYPAHFTVLMGFLVLITFAYFSGASYTPEFHTVPKFFYALFLINGIGIPDSVGWNFPSWTLSSEFVAYVCFPFLILWTTRLNYRQSFIVIVAIYATMFGLAFIVNNGESYYLPWTYILTRIASQFTVGCLLYNLASYPPLIRISNWIAPLTFVAVLVVSAVYEHEMAFGVLCILYAILIVTVANDSSSPLNTIFSSRPMVFLGEVSYSIYIVQNLTGIILSQVIKKSPEFAEILGSNVFFKPIVSLVAAIVGGTILHFTIEAPAAKWLNAHGKEIRLKVFSAFRVRRSVV